MAKVKMLIQITGTRNGKRWPAPGGTIDLPAAEADAYCAQGYCEPVKAKAKKPAEKRNKKKE